MTPTNDDIDERAKSRRKLIAVLTVVLPLMAGLLIAAVVHFAGDEEAGVRHTRPQQRRLVEAATPAAAGSPAPRVRLAEGGGGSFDGASAAGEPYAVVFISTRCEAIGGFLRRVATELGPGEAAVLAISADPKVDTRRAVRAWLSRNHLKPGGPFHYLVGDEGELRGYWNAWGFAGPAAACAESIPVHLVSGSGNNTGVLDVDPDSPASLLTDPLRGMAR